MASRLLAMLGLAALMAGPAPAQDNSPAKEESAVKARITAILETANGDIPKAISMLEDDLKTAPNDRQALYLHGAMTTVQAGKVDDPTARNELYRKSTASFAKLQSLHKDLTPYEKRFLMMSRVGEARVLASEKKPDLALAALKKAFDGGYDDFDALGEFKDLAAVRDLPAYKSYVEAATKAKVEEARKEVAEELADFKSFPFDFKLKDTDGKPVALADFKGKVTIVDVWGTWCPPCRQEIPHFVDLYKTYKDKGLEIVGINCNEPGDDAEKKKTIKEFAKETSISYPCVLNDEKTEEKIPGFQGYPTTLFLDRSGKVRMMLVGYTEKPKLEAIITALLANPAKPEEAKPDAK